MTLLGRFYVYTFLILVLIGFLFNRPNLSVYRNEVLMRGDQLYFESHVGLAEFLNIPGPLFHCGL